VNIANGHVRDERGRVFPWSHRPHLDVLGEALGPPAWVCVYPAYSGFIFEAVGVEARLVKIIGPSYPGRERMSESYLMRGGLGDAKRNTREALERRQLAFLACTQPLASASAVRPVAAVPGRLRAGTDHDEGSASAGSGAVSASGRPLAGAGV
jgi:hypothetical protein